MKQVDVEQEATPDTSALPDIHTVQRRPAMLALAAGIGALFLAGLASPALSAAVGVTFSQGLLVVCVFLGAVTLAFLAYYLLGPTSRVYRCSDYLEGFVLSWGVAYLIRASSAVHSFFWIFHGVQVLMTGLAGSSLVYLLTVCVGPAYLVVAFLSQGDAAGAWQSGIAGISGLFVYLMIARLSDQRDAALRREAALREELGRAWVARERARISRDLHDSVATELTALVWRVREISGALPRGSHSLDVASVAERLRSVIGDLRNVVLSLREPEAGFAALVSLVEGRCRELCGNVEFGLHIEGRVEDPELAPFQEQVLPICFELVNNAARHAQARRVELAVRVAHRLHVVVSDDGQGLSAHFFHDSRGGLQGVRQRVQRLGGTFLLEPSLSGARLAVELPRPLRDSTTELATG